MEQINSRTKEEDSYASSKSSSRIAESDEEMMNEGMLQDDQIDLNSSNYPSSNDHNKVSTMFETEEEPSQVEEDKRVDQ